jgi:2-polyprenyl-3-methyl-5-hydroxy-6-metoxy-1,4-benzoquinol methylase
MAAERYRKEIDQRKSAVKFLDEYSSSVHKFVNSADLSFDPLAEFKKSTIGQRFELEIRPNLPEELAKRAEIVFTGVLGLKIWRDNNADTEKLSEKEKGLQVDDADTIQAWVNQVIKPEEFPLFVPPAFSGWAERLTEKPIPHIAQANKFIGERIAEHFKSLGINKAKGVDLGAGTGATILAVEGELNGAGIEADISGVDLTPKLAEIAAKRTGKNIDVKNMLDWLKEQEDGSLDFVTSVYAMHHLSYEDQNELQQLALKKLKKGGILAIADPTGKSDFNLKVLDVAEPEAVMACFRPDVDNVIESLEGFHVITINKMPSRIQIESDGIQSDVQGNVLDQGTLGWAVVAVKS